MRLQELFRPEDVLVDFEPRDKWDAIDLLLTHMTVGGRIPQPHVEDISDAVVARERSMSTGMEHGISIPHAAVDGIEEAMAALGIVRRPEGVNFESIDGSHTQLVVLLLIPREEKLLHIRTLADVARVLGNESVRKSLVQAETAGEAWHALSEGSP